MKILIADDDPAVLAKLSNLVNEIGHEPYCVASGTEVYELLCKKEYSIAIIDWQLPDKPGCEICRDLREQKGVEYIYIIMLSSDEKTENIRLALESGANDYLTKSFNSIELKARINVGIRTAKLEKQMKEMNERLTLLASTDSLTKLLNHGSILLELRMELNRSKREDTTTGVMMLDIDDFKAVNDTYGHQVGDKVLKRFADTLKDSCRIYDRVGRYGGEEFLIVLPRTTLEQGLEIGERLRRIIEDISFDDVIEEMRITCSIGICASTSFLKYSSALVAAADTALYEAKESGKNRVMTCRKVSKENQFRL